MQLSTPHPEWTIRVVWATTIEIPVQAHPADNNSFRDGTIFGDGVDVFVAIVAL